MEPSEQPTTAVMVLAYIKDHQGLKYTGAVLSKVFNVSPNDINGMLQQLHKEHQVESITGHTQYYFISKPADVNLPAPSKRVRPFKAYVPPKAMGERCSELYPENRGFISVNGKE